MEAKCCWCDFFKDNYNYRGSRAVFNNITYQKMISCKVNKNKVKHAELCDVLLPYHEGMWVDY